MSVWAGVGAGLFVLATFELMRGRRRLHHARARLPPSLPRRQVGRRLEEASPPKRTEPLASRPRLAGSGLPAHAPVSPLPAQRPLPPALTSRIDLPNSAAGKSFARLVPFGDGREVIVRRDGATAHYGLEQGQRLVAIAGHEFLVVRYVALLSPPVLRPGEAPMSPEAARSYKPEYDVLYLPDAEVLIPREPRGFSDAEVGRILAAVSLSPLSPSTGDGGASEAPELAMACLRARSSTSYELKKAIQVVGETSPRGAVPLLRGYLRNTDLTVVEAACSSLARLGAREAIADLLDLLRPEAENERNIDCSGDPFGWHEAPPRASALLALTVMRVVEAEPAVSRLLSDVDSEVQRLARTYFEVLGLKVEG